MSSADIKAFDGRFVVLETDDDWYLGRLRVDGRRRTVAVFTGRTGKPPVLPFESVEAITLADEHAAVAPV